MKVCGFTFSEVETESLKNVFENANDSVRFSFVQSVLKSREPEINNCAHGFGMKSESHAERCFEASKQLANENKLRCAAKKLNEALAYSGDPKFANILVKQREIFLNDPKYTEPKAARQSLKLYHSSSVNQVYRGANQEFEAFSQTVKVKFTEEFGNHVVAIEDLEPGCVLGVEQPLASVLYPSCAYTHCSECFAPSHRLVPCQHCTQALYCSDSCRRCAWSWHHRLACQAATDLAAAGLSPLEMLSVRVMSRFGADKIIEALPLNGERLDATRRFASDSVRSFLHTFSNPQCWAFEEMLEKCIKAVLILRAFHLTQHPHASALGAFLLRSLHGIPLIAHEISERCLCNSELASDHGIGFGVLPAFSLVNHSCDPNVVRHNYGKCSVFRSLRRIPKGEQLVDSYGPHFVSEPLPLRTEMLKSRFRFHCICTACRLQFPTQQNLPWTITGVETSDDVINGVKFYLETGKVDCGLQAQLRKCISHMDARGLRMCQLYFVLQQMFKVIFASYRSL